MSSIAKRAMTLGVGAASVLCWTRVVLAYRPFTDTDAAIAESGALELEVGPMGLRRTGAEAFVGVPALVVNYGLNETFEAVFEAKHVLQLRHPLRRSRAPIEDGALLLKSVLKAGSLQGRKGLSVALESGLLLPSGTQRLGAHLATIVSMRWSTMTLHLNLNNDATLSHEYVPSIGVIAEGPIAWQWRPVAEILVARSLHGTRELAAEPVASPWAESVLLGAIGRINDSLSVDGAALIGSVDGRMEQEVRLGFTWAFEVMP